MNVLEGVRVRVFDAVWLGIVAEGIGVIVFEGVPDWVGVGDQVAVEVMVEVVAILGPLI